MTALAALIAGCALIAVGGTALIAWVDRRIENEFDDLERRNDDER